MLVPCYTCRLNKRKDNNNNNNHKRFNFDKVSSKAVLSNVTNLYKSLLFYVADLNAINFNCILYIFNNELTLVVQNIWRISERTKRLRVKRCVLLKSANHSQELCGNTLRLVRA